MQTRFERVNNGREARLPGRYTEAYELYLNGCYYWNKRTEEGLKQCIEGIYGICVAVFAVI